MNFSYENQGTHTYLVYTITEDDAVDAMSLGMLTNNKIAGLAHALFMQMDADKFIKYDVSARVSVKQFFAGQVNKKRLLGVFNGIVDAMLSAEDYMIDVNSILLDMDYIFADVTTCDTILICLPIENENAQTVDLSAFFKNIMFSTQFDPTENCDHVAKIINYLNSTPVFSLEDFKQVLESITNEMLRPVAVQNKPQPVVQKPPVQQPVVQKAVTPQPAQQQVQRPIQQPTQQPVHPPVQPVRNAQHQVTLPPKQKNVQPVQQKPGVAEKQISLFELLSHYNAENAALYKAQKAAKKSGKTAPQQPVSQPKPMNRPVQSSFAVPGQGAPTGNQGYAIPGQQPMVQQPTPKAQPRPQAAPVQPQTVQSQPVHQPAAPVYAHTSVPSGQPMNFGETTVLGGGNVGETTVLGAAANVQITPHLIRTRNNEKINLNKPVFRIGKEKSYVDYFIGDNSAISRSHANIISRDGKYFVVDTNSTNHTYVNGAMLQSNVETQISHGAKIKLANEDFEFRLY